MYGHFAADCRKPKREREVKQEVLMAKTEEDKPALLLATCNKDSRKLMLNEESVTPTLLTGCQEKKGNSNMWYLDNGDCNHMTGDKEKFEELNENITGTVKFGDGSTVKIEGKGSIIFRCKNGEERMLREVFYIPSLCSNIVSLGQLSEEGNKVILNGNYLWVYEEQVKLLMKVQRSRNRLYKLIAETVKSECLLTKSNETSNLWNIRLGHVNYLSMMLMCKNKMAYGLPNVSNSKEVCTGCLVSK